MKAAAPDVGCEVFDHGPQDEAGFARLSGSGDLVVVIGPRQVRLAKLKRLVEAPSARNACFCLVFNSGAPCGCGYYYGYAYYSRGSGSGKAGDK